nr:MAG: glycosyl transferase family 1 [Caldicoprobacter oshimai]
MAVLNKARNVVFVSTYPPRECGLATFTQDLVNELDEIALINKPRVIAMSNGNYRYDDRVIMEIEQYDRGSYVKAAKKLSETDTELVVIEHEYGIFGGDWGDYILDFVDNLHIPFIVTLHTVLLEPSDKQKEIIKVLAEKSRRVVTMANNTVKILTDVYGIDVDKIEVIHHGVPYKAAEPREKLKEKYGFKGRQIISTFGLISPGKGLEYAIEAVAEVAKKHREVLYIILGQTHPCVRKEYGESYREKLEALVRSLNVEENVQFVNRYLTKDEIIEYLQLSDIYMTPYLSKDQAVSGTLAYAVGYGKAIVSTPYPYAKEMLADGRGMLAEFADSISLARCINYILENPEVREEMEKKTLALGRTMTWKNIANQYAELFIKTIEENHSKGDMRIG